PAQCNNPTETRATREDVMNARWYWIALGFGLGVGLAWSDGRAQDGTPTPLGTVRRDAWVKSDDPPPRSIKRIPEPPQRRQTTPAQLNVQNASACWYVPNGQATTLQCNTGYWQTIMPDGTVVDGVGVIDPNAGLQGSMIQVNPATGGPTG